MDAELSPKATEIVACARSLLAAGGYNSFSYADISESVQISKASIHHHFPSKAELVQTVLARYREDGRVALAAMEQQVPDPVGQLKAYTDYWATCIREGDEPFCICAMLAAELPTIPSEVAEEVRGHFSDLAAWLTSVMSKGAAQGVFFLQGSARAEALAFMATVHGAMLSARAHADPAVFPAIVRPLMRRLTSRPLKK